MSSSSIQHFRVRVEIQRFLPIVHGKLKECLMSLEAKIKTQLNLFEIEFKLELGKKRRVLRVQVASPGYKTRSYNYLINGVRSSKPL